MKILPFSRPALKHFNEFSAIIPLARLIGHLEIGINAVGNIPQQHRCTLLAAVFNIQALAALAHLDAHLIAADIDPLNRLQDFYLQNFPAYCRLPQYGRQYIARSRWRNHGIADPLHF